jgi:hypothetical protein
MSKSKFTIIFILVKKFILFISQSLYLRNKRKNHQKIVKDKESFQLSRFRQSKWTNLMSKGSIRLMIVIFGLHLAEKVDRGLKSFVVSSCFHNF